MDFKTYKILNKNGHTIGYINTMEDGTMLIRTKSMEEARAITERMLEHAKHIIAEHEGG